jgi:hypothetical protein
VRSDDIAALMVAGMNPSTNGDLGFHQGVVTAWDEATGNNSVMVNGNTFTNLRVLSTSDSIFLAAGNTVGLLRFQSTYFILGRIAAPGAGAGLKPRADSLDVTESTGSTTYTDLPTVGRPSVANAFMGSSRKALVILSCGIAASQGAGFMGFEVSGASAIAPNELNSCFLSNDNAPTVSGTASATVLLTAADGLNQGSNTFTAKYKFKATTGGVGANFRTRRITVFPL